MDADSLEPISGVNITVVGSSSGGTSNEDGYFEIEVDILPALLFFSHVSYAINQELVSKKNRNNIRIYLQRETTDLGEVTISAVRIQKVDLGDTLNVLDYGIRGNRMIIVGSPYRKTTDQRLYLTNLMGDQLDNLPVSSVGRQIIIPEKLTPEHIYLFKDFMGSFHLLTRKNVKEIELSGDSLSLTYQTEYPDFMKYLFPMKAMLGKSLFYQSSTKEFNYTYRSGPDTFRPVQLKTIRDPIGIAKKPLDPERYPVIPGAPSYIVKNVSAPIIRLNDEILLFDFFKNNIEVFDSLGQTQRIVDIDFHTITRTYFWVLKNLELNQKRFMQEIILDEEAGKIYALFHPQGQRVTLKEINPANGQIVQEIEIPDLQNIDNIKIHRNIVYFTYQVKVYPYYTNIYRLKI